MKKILFLILILIVILIGIECFAVPVSEMTEATSVSGTDYIMAVVGGRSRKVKIENLPSTSGSATLSGTAFALTDGTNVLTVTGTDSVAIGTGTFTLGGTSGTGGGITSITGTSTAPGLTLTGSGGAVTLSESGTPYGLSASGTYTNPTITGTATTTTGNLKVICGVTGTSQTVFILSGTYEGKPYYDSSQNDRIVWGSSPPRWYFQRINPELLYYTSSDGVATPDLCAEWIVSDATLPLPLITRQTLDLVDVTVSNNLTTRSISSGPDDLIIKGTGGTIYFPSTSGTVALTTGTFSPSQITGTAATLSGTETLEHKTLNNPTLNSPVMSGTISGTVTRTGTFIGGTYQGAILSNTTTLTGGQVITTASNSSITLSTTGTGRIRISGGVASTTYATGELVVTGGIGCSEQVTVYGNVSVGGSLVVSPGGGMTTTSRGVWRAIGDGVYVIINNATTSLCRLNGGVDSLTIQNGAGTSNGALTAGNLTASGSLTLSGTTTNTLTSSGTQLTITSGTAGGGILTLTATNVRENMIYGGRYLHDATTAVTTGTTYALISGSQWQLGASNGMTTGTSAITVNVAGHYLVNYSLTATCNTSQTVTCVIFSGTTGSTTEAVNTKNALDTSNQNNSVSIHGTGFINCAANDIIQMEIKTTSAATVTCQQANITVLRVGN